MKTDGWFVEDVEDALESGADLGREADTLGFAAGEGVRGATEFEVAESDVAHELNAFTDFFKDRFGDEFF